ncbi:MAG: alpha/beta hydrolase [Pseudoramibacter sp.]|jgi:acetyl esterase
MQRVIDLNHPDYTKKATVYLNPEKPVRAAVLYFHGGGLLYGEREDLPKAHIEAFTGAGLAVIAFDYPLAPAADLDTILSDVRASAKCYIEYPEIFGLDSLPYFLWGRSAGAYLALMIAASEDLPTPPAGILSYYGYGFLTDRWDTTPSPYYAGLPQVSKDAFDAVPQTVHADGPMATHYSLYVYARQTGSWRRLIYKGRDKFFYLNDSLRNVTSLPAPLFAAHAIADPDVPFAEFTALCNQFNPQRFVAAGNVHDFDRETNTPAAKDVLKKSLAFVDSCLNA